MTGLEIPVVDEVIRGRSGHAGDPGNGVPGVPEPPLRAKVRRGLLKVERLRALARAVYYGNRGRITAREAYGQINAYSRSRLTLILACIIYWHAKEISRLAADPDFPFDPNPIQHVSPIERYNVALYGGIRIDPNGLWVRNP